MDPIVNSQCCFKGYFSFSASQFEKLLLPDSLDLLQGMQADFTVNFLLSEAGTVPSGCRLEKLLKFNFYLSFLRELSVGRGSTAPVGGGAFPKIHSVEPWDGKDGEVRSAPSLKVLMIC